jgi:hypothetical protein
MFRFLKNIFTKKEIEKEEIALNELENWFNEKTNAVFNDLSKKIESMKLNINHEIQKCYENIEELKKGELKNPKIPIRAKQAMEGNRDAYIKRIKIFLNNIDLDIKAHGALADFCDNFSKELDTLAKSTMKSYQILQEFLANESSNIAMNIRNLDNSMKELKSIMKNSKIKNIENLKNQIPDLKNQINNKGSLQEELNNKNNNAEDFKKSKTNLEGEIKTFEKSDEYINFKNLLNKKYSTEKEIEEHKDTLLHSFSILEKAFKKFSRIVFEDERLVKKYIERPIKTLIEDKELVIMKILGNLEKNLSENKLELEEKKKQRALIEVKRLDKGFFLNFLKKFNELDNDLEEINKELENNEIEKKGDELHNKLDSLDSEIGKIEEEINNKKNEYERINIQELKNDLQEKINNTLNKNITIS